jgi:hypothetical protein
MKLSVRLKVLQCSVCSINFSRENSLCATEKFDNSLYGTKKFKIPYVPSILSFIPSVPFRPILSPQHCYLFYKSLPTLLPGDGLDESPNPRRNIWRQRHHRLSYLPQPQQLIEPPRHPSLSASTPMSSLAAPYPRRTRPSGRTHGGRHGWRSTAAWEASVLPWVRLRSGARVA